MAKQSLSNEIAGILSDPFYWLGYLDILPNPDPILKKLGRDQEVYKDIRADPHVVGEIRATRSGLLSFEQQIQTTGETSSDKKALELCERVLQNNQLKWPDLTWQIAESIFFGYRLHEIIWERQDRFIVPKIIKDIPNRRLAFDLESAPRLLTKQQPIEGEKLEQFGFKFLLTRHMPENENPYGLALFSSCYWPYMFNHGGWKLFMKFVERFGNPWTVGKYPAGTSEEEQKELATKLSSMIEASVAVVSEETNIQLLEIDGKGELHEKFINLLNKEMSKALTSQTLATEIQGQGGSRAAAETHRGREKGVNQSDRQLVSDTFNQLLGYITTLNFPNAIAPKHQFYEESEAAMDWGKLFVDTVGIIGNSTPLSFVHEKLHIPMAKAGEETLVSTDKNNESQPLPVSPQSDENADENADENEEKFNEYAQQNAGVLEKWAQEGSNKLGKILPIDRIHQGLSESQNLDDFDKNLMQLYVDRVDKKKHIKLIKDALIISKLYALSEIQDEIESKRLFAAVQVGDLPFNEAIDFFKEKIDIPTKHWYDLQREQHDLAFVIAGATQADLLNDMHNALSKALENGSTLNDFRKNFDQIVGTYGWSYKGGRNWRTQVIFETNMHSARAAGKWEQYQRVKEERPFLRYVSVRDHRTRPNHSMLHNTIRPIDDDFWGFYYPPLGYRCRCTTVSYNDRQLGNKDLKVTDSKKVDDTLRKIGNAWVTDPRTGEKKMLNNALTIGFDYTPGKYKEQLQKQMLNKSEHYFPELQKQFLEKMNPSVIKQIIE